MKIEDFKLERFFSVHEFSAEHMICGSDCESMTVDGLISLDPSYEMNLKDLWLGYTESKGHPELREEISNLYEDIGPEDILVFSGAEEGIFVFMNSVLSRGDHVITQFPAYQSLYGIARSIGASMTKWEMKEGTSWDLDLDDLERSIREKTKLIVVNSPHNPTGHILPKEAQRALSDIADDRGILVFSDEVYRFLDNMGDSWMSSMADSSENCFSLGVMSKSYGLAGLRIGWIASKNAEAMERMARFKDYTSICNSAPSELFSIMALRNAKKILDRNRAIIKDNLSLFEGLIKKHDDILDWARPDGGSTGFPRLRGNSSSEAFAKNLLESKGVLVLPSKYMDYDDLHFRVGLGRMNFSKGLELLDLYMEGL